LALGLPPPFGLCREQEGAQPMPVAADHSQGHVTLEAVEAMIGAAVEAMGLQGIDRRFHGGMPTPQVPELWVVLAPGFAGAALTFFG
jgi:hypothetical protein